MDTIPFAALAAERKRMLGQLRSRSVPDRTVHRRAVEELSDRLGRWWGSTLPPRRRVYLRAVGDASGVTDLPIVLTPDPMEPLIVRAIVPAEPALFGVTKDGALYFVDTGRGFRVFITYLSPLLDEVTVLLRHVVGGINCRFIMEDGCFFADLSKSGEYRPFAVVGSARVSAVVDRCLDELGRPLKRAGVGSLLVDFGGGKWPSSGVLSKMGYHVGRGGLAPAARRQVLRKVVDVVLVGGSRDAEAYIREWGGPRSEMRVQKIARCLGSFASGASRRRADLKEAIADWEDDLRWLRRTYGR